MIYNEYLNNRLFISMGKPSGLRYNGYLNKVFKIQWYPHIYIFEYHGNVDIIGY